MIAKEKETENEITRLMDLHGIIRKDACRKYLIGFLESNPDFNIENAIKDLANVQKNLTYSEIKTQFPENYHKAVIVNCGDEFDAEEFLKESTGRIDTEDKLDKAVEEAFPGDC